MKRLSFCKFIVILIVSLLCVLIYSSKITSINTYYATVKNIEVESKTVLSPTKVHQTVSNKIDRIVLSLVVCDQRYNESLNVIKSVLLFTTTPTYFVIFADDTLLPKLNSKLKDWKLIKGTFDFELQRINFPEKHREDWMNLFSKCAAQRLFIPSLASHIDSMIYVDTDTLFLGPADDLWRHFYSFQPKQISAMTLEDDNPNVSWYPRFAKHPFYGKFGLNSGVMLMNLTRMRSFHWVDYVTPIMLKWKLSIPWGDQDIINIIFHYHGDAVYELSCRYNYRTDQCMYGDACAEASEQGIQVLHGSRRAFHANKQPAFQAMYRALDEFELGSDPLSTILLTMQQYFDEAPTSNCGNLRNAFLKVPIETINALYGQPDR